MYNVFVYLSPLIKSGRPEENLSLRPLMLKGTDFSALGSSLRDSAAWVLCLWEFLCSCSLMEGVVLSWPLWTLTFKPWFTAGLFPLNQSGKYILKSLIIKWNMHYTKIYQGWWNWNELYSLQFIMNETKFTCIVYKTY